MALIRTYEPGQVARRPVSNARFQAVDGTAPEIGRGLAQIGQGLGDAASAQVRIDDMLDEAATKQLDNEYETFERTTLFGDDQTQGFYAKKGVDALNARKGVETALKDKAAELAARATTAQQRRLFGDVTTNRLNRSLEGIGRYSQQEVGVYNRETTAARVYTFGQSASALWADPKEQAIKKAAGLSELQEQGKLEGWGADVYAMKSLEFTSGVHAGALAQMVQTDPRKANDYLTRWGGEMTARDRAQFLVPIQSAVTQLDAQDFADGLLGSGAAGVATPGAGNPVASLIDQEAAAQGVDPATAKVFAMIESGMRPGAKNGQSYGVFQLQDDPWRQMGGTAENRSDPKAQVALGVKYIKRTTDRLQAKLGRPPAAWEVYMAHQQGDAGGYALMTAPPEVNAVAVLEGIGVSPKIARLSITGNGGTASMTAGQFVAQWRQKFATKAAQGAKAAAGSYPATMNPGAEPDLNQMLAAARAASGGDPDRRRAMEAAARGAYSQLAAAKTAGEQNAADALQPYLAGPQAVQKVGDIPSSIMTKLSPQARTAVYNHFGNGGYPKDSDVQTLTDLYTLVGADPTRFKQINIIEYAGKLSEGDYKSLISTQATLRQGGQKANEAQVTSSRISSVTNDLLRGAGIDPRKKPEQAAQFTTSMLRSVEYFKAQNGRNPTDKEIIAIADNQLLEGTLENGLFDKKVRNFEVPVGRGRDFRIKIPGKARQEITSSLTTRLGRAPTTNELEATYRRLVARGIY